MSIIYGDGIKNIWCKSSCLFIKCSNSLSDMFLHASIDTYNNPSSCTSSLGSSWTCPSFKVVLLISRVVIVFFLVENAFDILFNFWIFLVYFSTDFLLVVLFENHWGVLSFAYPSIDDGIRRGIFLTSNYFSSTKISRQLL